MLATILASGILITFILLFRKSFGQKISCRFIYGLWLLPAMRLLVLPLIEVPEHMSIISGITHFFKQFNLLGIYSNTNNGTKVLIIINRFLNSRTALFIWFAGMVTVLLWHIVPYVKMKRKLKSNRTLIEKKEGGQVCVYSSELIRNPVIAGFDIYLPKAIVQSDEYFEFALAHEYEHFRQLDIIWNLLRMLSACIYWFNPFVWMAVSASQNDREYACDEAVTQNKTYEQKVTYCKMLIEQSSGIILVQRNSGLESDMIKGAVTKRVEMILCEREKHGMIRIVTVALFIAFMLLSLCTNSNPV